MVIAPVSLTFLSVPVSSWAFAEPARQAAASARAVIGRRFIIFSSLDNGGMLPHSDLSLGRPLVFRLMQRPSHRMSRDVSHSFIGIRVRRVGRLGELLLQLRTDRRVEIQSLWRNFLHEPLVIQLLAFAALIHGRGGAIDYLLERRVVLAQHDPVR